jgi:hypothetical protein
MASGNGESVGEAIARVVAAEADTRELRQLFMSELRLVRVELKGLVDQVRDTGRAVDTLLAELRLRDAQEGTDG